MLFLRYRCVSNQLDLAHILLLLCYSLSHSCFYSLFVNNTTACACMPSSLHRNSNFSFVVVFTLTSSIDTSKILAILSLMLSICGLNLGFSAIIVASTFPSWYPFFKTC